MKKFIFCFTSLFLITVLAQARVFKKIEIMKQNPQGTYDAIAGRLNDVDRAILVSDYDTVKEKIDSLDPMYLDGELDYAIGICEPYRSMDRSEYPTVAVCDKEKNAQIICLLMEKGADPNWVFYDRNEANSNHIAKTEADYLKQNNPAALKYILPKLNKCLVALTQMQNADDKKEKYYVYADFWRDNKCSLKNFKADTDTFSDKERLTLYSLIGESKEDVYKAFGDKPTVYDRPSQHREVITYKKAVEEESSSSRGSGMDYYVKEYHYVFTVDRGVVTRVQMLLNSTTKGGQATQVRDYEKLKEIEQERKEQNAGKIANPRKRMYVRSSK